MSETRGPVPSETRVSGRRFLAHWVDGTIFTVLWIGAILLLGLLPEGTLADILLGVTLVGGFTVGQVAYYVLTQRRNGKTPGKALARIRVVDARGRVPATGALVKRTWRRRCRRRSPGRRPR